jgi:hypothetical protein
MTRVTIDLADYNSAKEYAENARLDKNVLRVTIESDTIPGVPSTAEQLCDSVDRAQKQLEQGLGVSHKEAFQKYEEMYKGAPGW